MGFRSSGFSHGLSTTMHVLRPQRSSIHFPVLRIGHPTPLGHGPLGRTREAVQEENAEEQYTV